MSDLSIPTNVEELTPAWFNTAMNLGSDVPIGPLRAVEAKLIGVGVGLVAGLYRCALSYESESAQGPKSVVVKLRSNDPKSLKVAKMFMLYQKEVTFYRDIAPLSPIQVPKVFYSDFDLKSHDFVLILEDMAALENPSQLVGGTQEQGKLAVRHAANLHSRFHGRDREPPLKDYFSLVEPSITTKIHVGFRNSVPKVLTLFDSDLSPVTKDLIRSLGENLAGHYREIAKAPCTLSHGDYRLDNMFFGQPGTEKELVVIDWQTNGIAVGMTDVAYFMAGSLEPDVRRSIERDALEEYHDITCREGGADWSKEQCWLAYRQSMVAALTVPVIAAGELSLENQDALELVTNGIKRMNTAIEELDVAEFSPRRRSIFSISGIQSTFANQLARMVSNNSA